MTTTNHDMADDMAEFGAKLNEGRIGKLTGEELDRAIADRAYPMRRAPNGCDYQGRYPLEAASCCTEIGADGEPDVWESADHDVLVILAKAFLSMIAFVLILWMLQP